MALFPFINRYMEATYKRNSTFEEKLIEVLDKQICNLTDEFRTRIYNDMITNHYRIFLDKVKIKKFILHEYMNGGVESGKTTARYWIYRGWDQYVAEVKAEEYRKKIGVVGRVSPFSAEFWLGKFNEKTGHPYTYEEAKFKGRSQNPCNKEYWLNLGYGDDESIELSQNRHNDNSNKGSTNLKNKPKGTQKNYSKRSKQYWLNRGFNEFEAEKKVAEHQTNFSLDICVAKYGEEKGKLIWKRRQDKWQTTLNLKSEEEQKEINRKKTTINGSVSVAEQEITHYLIEHGLLVKTQENVTGRYVADFVIDNKVVEYFGDFWHCNPEVYDATFLNTKTDMFAEEVWEKDEMRLRCIRDAGYDILVVWEKDYKKDKENVLNKIKEFFIS